MKIFFFSRTVKNYLKTEVIVLHWSKSKGE